MKKILVYLHSTYWIWHSKRISLIVWNLVKNYEFWVDVLMSWLDHRFLFENFRNVSVFLLPKLEYQNFYLVENSLNSKKSFLRKQIIKKLIQKNDYCLLLIEYFPFWRLYLRDEIVPMFDCLKNKNDEIKIFTSLRDIFDINILSRQDLKYINKILIHWDKKIKNYDDDFKKLWIKNYEYTWFVVDNISINIENSKKVNIITINIWYWVIPIFFEFIIDFLKKYKKIDNFQNFKIYISLWKLFNVQRVEKIKSIYKNVECFDFRNDLLELKLQSSLNVIMWWYNNLIESVRYKLKSIVYVKWENLYDNQEQISRLESFQKICNFIKNWEKIDEKWIHELLNLEILDNVKVDFDWIENVWKEILFSDWLNTITEL